MQGQMLPTFWAFISSMPVQALRCASSNIAVSLCRSWLYPVFMMSDAELMRTAGLDNLMLCWTATLGIQVINTPHSMHPSLQNEEVNGVQFPMCPFTCAVPASG